MKSSGKASTFTNKSPELYEISDWPSYKNEMHLLKKCSKGHLNVDENKNTQVPALKKKNN